MKLTLNKVLSFLEGKHIAYEILNDQPQLREKEFQLASIKNKISNGFYYLNAEFMHELAGISDSLILTNATDIKDRSNIYLVVKNPQLVHYKVSTLFEKLPQPGIHPTAIVDPGAEVSQEAYIGPYCVLGKCKILSGVCLMGNVTVNDGTLIMSNTLIEQNCVLGARGMAWIWDDDGSRVMQPQLGGVTIGENCLIGTDVTVVRGSLSENTVIGDGCVIAHGTKIGHGCTIRKFVHMANNVSLAGNVLLEDRVFRGSASVISSNVVVREGCIVGAGTVISKTIDESYATIAGVPGRIIKRNNFESKPAGAPRPFKSK